MGVILYWIVYNQEYNQPYSAAGEHSGKWMVSILKDGLAMDIRLWQPCLFNFVIFLKYCCLSIPHYMHIMLLLAFRYRSLT